MKTNYFELRGFVGNPPDVRFTPNGKTVATFSLYTKERWSDSSEKTSATRIAPKSSANASGSATVRVSVRRTSFAAGSFADMSRSSVAPCGGMFKRATASTETGCRHPGPRKRIKVSNQKGIAVANRTDDGPARRLV